MTNIASGVDGSCIVVMESEKIDGSVVGLTDDELVGDGIYEYVDFSVFDR